MAEDREERIRRRAHELWERDGRPEGMHEVHWLQASREIEAEDEATAQASGRRKRTKDDTVTGTVRRSAKKAAGVVSGAAEAVAEAVSTVAETVVRAVKPKRSRKEKATPSAAQPNSTSAASPNPPNKAPRRSRTTWSPADIKPSKTSAGGRTLTAASGFAKTNTGSKRGLSGKRTLRAGAESAV